MNLVPPLIPKESMIYKLRYDFVWNWEIIFYAYIFIALLQLLDSDWSDQPLLYCITQYITLSCKI